MVDQALLQLLLALSKPSLQQSVPEQISPQVPHTLLHCELAVLELVYFQVQEAAFFAVLLPPGALVHHNPLKLPEPHLHSFDQLRDLRSGIGIFGPKGDVPLV